MEIEIETMDSRHSYRLRPGRTLLGRAPENDIVVPSEVVSKHHLQLWCDDATSVRVRDLDSKNGSALNGAPLVGEQPFEEGDQVVLGGRVYVRLRGAEQGFENTLTPATLSLLPPEDREVLERVRRRAPETAEAVAELLIGHVGQKAAVDWACERVADLASAPTVQARYRYLVAETRRQLAPTLPGDPSPDVWVLQWSQSFGASTPSFSALVHDQDLPQDVPSPSELATSIVGRAMASRQPTWLDDARAEESHRSDSVMSLRLRSVGCVPIGQQAVLYVSDPRERGAFSPEMRARIEALCHLAGQIEEPVFEGGTTWTSHAILPGIYGQSAAMQDLARQARAFSQFGWNVLVLGPPGTGKTAMARAIHDLSGREGPFVHVNCATLTDTLAAAELFGAVKGAYNDARERPGYVGTADGGTLFLDEVGELPMALQSTLLVLTRERTYHRVGEEESPRSFTGRIIAATNQSLTSLRPDLAERLMECLLEIPPLSDRRDDVPELAKLFLRQLCESEAETLAGRTLTLSAGALELLTSGPLHGNVAALKSAIQRAFMWAVVQGADRIEVAHIDTRSRSPRASVHAPETLEDAVSRFKRHLFEEALERNGGNKTQTAEELGMTNRQQLIRQLKKVGLMD